MKLVVYGDSITKGTYTKEGDKAPLSVASPCFSEIIAKELCFSEMINYGYNGVSISSTSSVEPQLAIVKRVDMTETGDVVLIAAGTNDFGTVVLGKENDTEDVSFYGALECLCKKLRVKYDGNDVWFFSPMHRNDEAAYPDKNLEDYKKAIESKTEKYGFHFINGFHVPLNPGNREYFYDGVHPNDKAHRVIAEYIISEFIRQGFKRK